MQVILSLSAASLSLSKVAALKSTSGFVSENVARTHDVNPYTKGYDVILLLSPGIYMSSCIVLF